MTNEYVTKFKKLKLKGITKQFQFEEAICKSPNSNMLMTHEVKAASGTLRKAKIMNSKREEIT